MNVVEALRLPGLEEALARVEAGAGGGDRGDGSVPDRGRRAPRRAGGKRLRPALVVAAASASGLAAGARVALSDEVIQGGVAVELVHLGSLYHDDVMDEAEHRRGVESVNARWGNLVAILAGDFLLARASEIAASLGTEVAALLARTIGQLCEGEVGQLRYAFDPDRPEAAYLPSIAGKTASLMATSARIGGLVSGAPRPVDRRPHRLRPRRSAWPSRSGTTSGTWSAPRSDLGKPAGHDMVEGTYTLPVLRALADPRRRRRPAGPARRPARRARPGTRPGT